MAHADLERKRAYERTYKAANWERDREKKRAYLATYALRRMHGMLPEDWAALHAAQQGLCYLCGEELAGKISVDHDHDHCPPRASCRNCRRGLVHDICNRVIGMAGDDAARLRRMADALEAAQQACKERVATAIPAVQELLFE